MIHPALDLNQQAMHWDQVTDLSAEIPMELIFSYF